MRNNSGVMEVEAAAPALTPDMVAKIKKEDMKQAVVERFSTRTKPAEKSTATRTGQRP
jgi:hypothetical protein